MTVALFRKKKDDDEIKLPLHKDPMPEIQKQMEERYGVDAVRNFLDMIPKISVEWVDKEGCIGIYNERFKSERARRIGMFMRLNRYYFVRIREENKYGQFIWKNIDGKRTVREIGVAMFAEFSDDETLSYQRVKMFMDILKRNDYICFVEPGELAQDDEPEMAEAVEEEEEDQDTEKESSPGNEEYEDPPGE